MNVDDYRITEERLEKLAEASRFFIDRWLSDGDSVSFQPQVMVEARGPLDSEASIEINVLAVPFNTHQEKHAAMHGVGKSLYERQRCPLAAVLLSEAWISSQPRNEPRKYLLPENDPERLEAVIYHLLSLDGRVRHGYRPVRRDRKDMMTAGGDWVVYTPSSGKVSSRLVSSVFRGFISQLPPHMSDEFLRPQEGTPEAAARSARG